MQYHYIIQYMFNGVHSIDVITFCIFFWLQFFCSMLPLPAAHTFRACVPHKPLQRQLRHDPAISTHATTVESREDL